MLFLRHGLLSIEGIVRFLTRENKILMEQNKALSKEILSLEKGGKLKRKMTLDEALELAYKESRKNTRNTWVINKTNKGSN